MRHSPKTISRSRQRGFSMTEMLVASGIIAILAALLLPTLGRSKAKANRIKCLNNLATIGKALNMYGHDFDGRLPWQILEPQQRVQLGSKWSDFTLAPAAIFSLPPMVREIGNAKVLLSPCDPERATANEKAEAMWAELDPAQNKILPDDAISYLLIEGGDIALPTTVLAVTRNISDCDLRQARWVGADETPVMDQAMAGLMRGEGQLVMADASVHLSDDDDLGTKGMIVRPHVKSAGGNSVEEASAHALGCGHFVRMPITEVFVTESGNHHTFIIDKSGSMGADNRLVHAQNALLNALTNMKPTKKFYVFFFYSSTRVTRKPGGRSIAMKGGPRHAFRFQVDLIRPWIEKQTPGGGTDPREAIRDAFERIHPDTIWILTDGWFNGKGGGAGVRQLIAELNTNRLVRVNTVGYARTSSQVDRRTLSAIASDNNGTFYFSPSGHRD